MRPIIGSLKIVGLPLFSNSRINRNSFFFEHEEVRFKKLLSNDAKKNCLLLMP